MQTSVPAYQAGENETQREREKGGEGETEEFKKSGEMSVLN